VIPAVAVQRGPQGTYVYAVGADKTAQMKPVTIALTTGDVAVIGKGLDGGERVIVEGQNQVRPGGRVEPAPAGGAAPGPARPPGERRKRGDASADDAPATPTPPATRSGSGSAASSSRRLSGQPLSGQPLSGQPRSRGPAAGPTASLQPASQ
jgi:multidrug efflux system membrane fusion protein